MSDKSPGLSFAAQPALLANLVRAIFSLDDTVSLSLPAAAKATC